MPEAWSRYELFFSYTFLEIPTPAIATDFISDMVKKDGRSFGVLCLGVLCRGVYWFDAQVMDEIKLVVIWRHSPPRKRPPFILISRRLGFSRLFNHIPPTEIPRSRVSKQVSTLQPKFTKTRTPFPITSPHIPHLQHHSRTHLLIVSPQIPHMHPQPTTTT